MKETIYRVANHIFSLITSPCIEIDGLIPSLKPFILESGKVDEVLFTLNLSYRLPDIPHTKEIINFEWEDAQCTIYTTPEGFEISLLPHEVDTIYRMQTDSCFERATALLHNQPGTDGFAANNFLMMLYTFATAPLNTLMFHASVIIHNERGYLFLGKSGTGKSTHSCLWLEHIPGSELLNDDNPIVRYYSPKKIMVYGSPWSGKTPCYRNKEVPVGAFVRLKQASSNQISRQNVPQTFVSLLSSCSCFRKHQEQFDGVCNSVGNLAPYTPCYLLECLPDAGATELCFSTVSRS